jgi:hypothetical protein
MRLKIYPASEPWGMRVELTILPFHRLAERHPGLTPAIGESCTEAARVCLDRHHTSPIVVSIDRPDAEALAKVLAEWSESTARERQAWANETDTTEQGAYAVALAAVELDGLVAVRRAETRTGADYYISALGAPTDDLENCLRLEVSGVDRGDEHVVNQRLHQKVMQALSGASNLPALAAVVGFRACLIALDRAEGS